MTILLGGRDSTKGTEDKRSSLGLGILSVPKMCVCRILYTILTVLYAGKMYTHRGLQDIFVPFRSTWFRHAAKTSFARLLIIVFYHHPRIFFRGHSGTLYTIQQCLNKSQCNCWIGFRPRDISFISLVIITPVIRRISLRLWLIVWDGSVKVNLYFTYIQWIWHFKLDDAPPTSSYYLTPHFTYQPSYV